MTLTSDEAKLVETRWRSIRNQFSQHWPELTQDDLKLVNGDSRKLVAIVHQRTGRSLPEIEEVIDDIASNSGGLLSRISNSVIDVASNTAAQVSETASVTYERSAESIGTAYDALGDSIKRSPATVLPIAFGVGVLFGLMLSSSSSPQRRNSWR